MDIQQGVRQRDGCWRLLLTVIGQGPKDIEDQPQLRFTC